MRRSLSFVVASVFMLSACREAPPARPDTPPPPQFRPDASIKDIMDAFIDPAADHIWDAVATTVTAKGREEKYPRTDEEWKELRRRAIQIMEGANLLLIPGRHVGKPGETTDPRYEMPSDQVEALINKDRAAFTALTYGLYESVRPALQAIEAKDKDKLLEAGDGIDGACEACHAKFWYAKR
jgi:hypothetical protein